ncbi:MAG: 50S ribosomal protein L2 [Candidatus Nanosyncoccaceae bacterium]|jgi:large subunit ribosomal protein L2
MAVRKYNPTTPGRRDMTTQDMSEVTTKKPMKSLLAPRKQKAGRNNAGKITIRHRGGGAKRNYRIVSYALPAGTVATIEEIEYDPNRSARIARIKDQDGKYYYILADIAMKKGEKIKVGTDIEVEESNRMPLEDIPVGSFVYAIELVPGKGAQLIRAAGTTAQLMAKEGDLAQIKMPSGEVRMVPVKCMASIGTVSNVQHQNVVLGSAGRKRRQGIRPTVRGVVMNPADHPHGGGEGRHGTGKAPRTPWGKLALGRKTRRNKSTNRMIVKSRHESKRK